MNRLITLYIIICCCAILTSCDGLPNDLNDNPNDLTVSDVETRLFLNGAQLANSLVQAGNVSRVAGLYSGQMMPYWGKLSKKDMSPDLAPICLLMMLVVFEKATAILQFLSH